MTEKPRFKIHHKVIPIKKQTGKKQSPTNPQSINTPECVIDELYRRDQLSLSCDCKRRSYKKEYQNRILVVICRDCKYTLKITDFVFRQLQTKLQQIKRQEYERIRDQKK